MGSEIVFPAGTLVKVDGLPFWLKSDAPVIGNVGNLRLIRQDRSLGVPSACQVAQSELSETRSPSSASMNCLK